VDWYYAKDKERHGPVSEAEFERLVNAGDVVEDTLVWREGMEQWRPYWSVSRDGGGAVAAPPVSPGATSATATAPAGARTIKTANGSSIRLPSLVRKGGSMPLPDHPVVEEYGASYALAPHDLHLFPALLRAEKTVEARAVLEDGEASCYYHPNFAATTVCDHSGRFICDLCAVEWEDGTISLQALEEIKRSGKSDKLKDQRTMWDDIALALTLMPILTVIFWFLLIVTAPIALFICVWKWREGPTGLTRRSRWRYVVAGLLAVAEIAFFVLVFTGFMNNW